MLIVTITGKSGVGKDTIAEYLASKYGWNIIRSYTTRPMREGETNGKEHWFVKDPPVRPEDCFAYTKYGGYEYWTKLGQFRNDNVNIYIVDEKGLFDVIDKAEKYDFRTFKIAVWCSDRTRIQRGVKRERMDRDRNSRLKTDATPIYDSIIINNGTIGRLQHRLDDIVHKIVKRQNKK